MRMNFVSLLTLILILTLSPCPNAGAASTGECQLKAYWNTLTVRGGDYGVGWDYIGLNSETWINGPESTNPGYVLSQSPWQSEPLTWTLGNNTAFLSSGQELISNTSSSSRGDGDQSGWINGNNHRGMSLALLPNTTYTFSLNYSIDVNLSRENADQENASNYSQVSLWLTEFDPGSVRIETQVEPFNSNFPNGSLEYDFSDSGTITLIVTTLEEGTPFTTIENDPFLGYDRYWFETHLHTSTWTSSTFIPAPVPVPAPVLLLGSGLIGLAGFRRKLRDRKQ